MEPRAKNAFIVWLDDVEPHLGPAVHGRIEHVASATRARFESQSDLLAFIQRFLAHCEERAAREPDDEER